jgi:hypothetical protein
LPQANEVNVSVKNELLVFKTTDDYRRVADNLSSAQMIKFVNDVKNMDYFLSYYEYFSNNKQALLSDGLIIDPDFLQTVLNKDAAVQIGKYIYKIDVQKEKVFTLDTAHAGQYSDVVSGNTANSNIRAFSIGDDVLDLTSGTRNAPGDDDGGSGGGGTGGPCNSCTVGENQNVPLDTIYSVPFVSGTENREINCKIKYERYGIYFTLYSRMDHPSGTSVNQTYYLIDVDIYYHIYNGVTNGPYTDTKTSNLAEGALKYQSYNGSKRLTWIWFKSRWGIKVTDGSIVVTYPRTSWKEIRVNI